jgi:hypothetical protein
MIEGFYSVCEPHLTRRRFLKFAMVAGMVPALTSRGYAARDTEAGVRRFIERYAVGPEVAAFGVQVLQEATQGLTPYATAGLPLTKKLPIHHFTCGGTHLCYSVLVAARHGLLRAAGGDIVQDQLRMLIYRLQADPELIDRARRRPVSRRCQAEGPGACLGVPRVRPSPWSLAAESAGENTDRAGGARGAGPALICFDP